MAGYSCQDCGAASPKWAGRCAGCGAWGSLVEANQVRPARPISQVDPTAARAVPTGIEELDRVLGGGLGPGAVVLLAGEPGVGKSTLLLDVAARAARSDRRALVISAEESAAQVRSRAGRIGAVADGLFLAAETDVPAVLHQLEEVRPRLLVVDSVQTVAHPDVDGAAGGVSQVRAVAAALARVAKANGITVLLVGHVTKEGSVAGPRSLEHLVDVVLFFEGERHSRLRLLRAVKNRFGGTEELGCFDLGADGIVGLADPSGLFLSRTQRQVPGTCVTVTLDGRRALLAEVQALVAAAGPAPRRVCSGVDPARLAMVLAVLDRRAGVPVSGRDVYTATVGGARLNDPAADLAAALAIAGAASDRITPAELVAIGEVGLAGEVRSVRGLDRRLAEAARLGFRRAVVPADVDPAPDGLLLQPVAHLADALAVLTRPTVTVLSPDELMIAGKLG